MVLPPGIDLQLEEFIEKQVGLLKYPFVSLQKKNIRLAQKMLLHFWGDPVLQQSCNASTLNRLFIAIAL